jgi:putative aldouronate transport system permease protein
MSMKKKADVFDIINYVVLTLLIIIIVYPFLYVVVNSFNALSSHRPSFFWPEQPTLMTYQTVFKDESLLHSFWISVLRTVVGTSFTVIVTSLCSYAMSKNFLKFRPLYVVLFTIPSFFNGGMVPVYLNIRNLGLLDTFWVYILPAGFSFFYMVLMISAFRAIPESLEEAAFIDGAGFFSVFVKIILPVSVPTLATVALYAAVGQWNAWYDTMFYTNKNSLQTLSSVLMRIVRENNLGEMTSELTSDMENRSYNPEGVKMATMVVSVLPIIFIYPFLQRYFVKGIMVGSIKG